MSEKLLIVEDDKKLNDGIRLALKNDAYFLYQCRTLQEAREILKKEDITLVLLDVNLPDGNGIDFVRDNVKFWPFSISNRFLCIHRNSYPIFFSVRYRKSNELKSRALLDRRWHLMYLHISFIQCCRCLYGNRCIYTGLIFAIADALF